MDATQSRADTDGMTNVTARLPLTGRTVIALEQAVAAPLATRHLADLGAE